MTYPRFEHNMFCDIDSHNRIKPLPYLVVWCDFSDAEGAIKILHF